MEKLENGPTDEQSARPRSPRVGPYQVWGRLILAVLAIGIGLCLMVDNPGLRVDYFALDPNWSEPPIYSEIGLPQVESRDDLIGLLLSRELFSIRWRGWLEIDETAVYRFMSRSENVSYLMIDDEVLFETRDRSGQRQRRAQRELSGGLHSIEIGFSQTGGRARLRTRWSKVGQEWALISGDSFYASRPGFVRSGLRNLLAGLDVRSRKMLGALLFAIGASAALGVLKLGFLTRVPSKAAGSALKLQKAVEALLLHRGLQIVLILVAVLVVWRVVYPYTGSTADGDDVRYLYAAAFAKKMGWIMNRYAHVYLLRAFMIFRDGEAFLGSRLYWSFMFAVTVGGLAFGVRCLGKGLQIRTLAIALFLLASQVSFFGGIGVAYADYTAMMFITLAVSAYMHGLYGQAKLNGEARSHEESSPSLKWHAFLIGALTVAAIKSKETGLILLWLPLLFLWSRGSIDFRRFFRSILYWIGGGVAAYLVLMMIDARVLGDFWFSVKPETLSGLTRLHGASEGKSKWDSLVWLEVVWTGTPRLAPTAFSLRHLGLLVLISGGVAFAQRKQMEVRLLHLMPVAYIVLMITIHPAFFSTRFLIPIIPVSCLLGAMLFSYVGLEALPWSKFASPWLVVPIVLTLAIVSVVVVPARLGQIPVGGVNGAAGTVALVSTLLGIISIVALVGAGCALVFLKGQARLGVMLVCLIGFFGPSYQLTQRTLQRKLSVQRGNLILYPWMAFKEEIEAARPRRLTISRDLVRRYDMTGQRITRNRLARMMFRRVHLRVGETSAVYPNLECLIGDRSNYRGWIDEIPELEMTAVSDHSGQFVMVTPRAVVRSGG